MIMRRIIVVTERTLPRFWRLDEGSKLPRAHRRRRRIIVEDSHVAREMGMNYGHSFKGSDESFPVCFARTDTRSKEGWVVPCLLATYL
jgi:hypothetical protein